MNPILDTDAPGGETTVPPDDELAEFFRAVLPDQEPPLPHRFVTDARLSGQRIKARRRLRLGITTIAVCAVLAGAGTAVWTADRVDRPVSATARPDTPDTFDDSAAIGRLALAVQQNLIQHVRDNSSDMVVMPPRSVVDARPTVWRIELTRNGLRIGWIDITVGTGAGPDGAWQLRCPVQAFDSRDGDSVVCALPAPAPDADPRIAPGSRLVREPIEVLVIGEETGLHIRLTATGGRPPGAISDESRRQGDAGKTDSTDSTDSTDDTDGVGGTDHADQTARTDPMVPTIAAPVGAVEMSEILRHGDAPAALTALLGIGV